MASNKQSLAYALVNTLQQFTPWLGWLTCAEIIIIRSNWSCVDASHAVHYSKWEADSVSRRPRWQLLPVHLPLCSTQGTKLSVCGRRVCVWCVYVCVHVCACVAVSACLWFVKESGSRRGGREIGSGAFDISHCWQVSDGVLTAHESDVFISAGMKHIWTGVHSVRSVWCLLDWEWVGPKPLAFSIKKTSLNAMTVFGLVELSTASVLFGTELV